MTQRDAHFSIRLLTACGVLLAFGFIMLGAMFLWEVGLKTSLALFGFALLSAGLLALVWTVMLRILLDAVIR